MTFAQILADLKNMIGSGVTVSDAGLKTWINDAYLTAVDEVHKANPDYFAKKSSTATIASQGEYLLPDDFDKAIMVNVQYGSQWFRAKPMPNVNFTGVLADSTTSNGYSTADPYYYILNGAIGLMPIPSESGQTISLWYTYTPAEMTSDSDEPALPVKYHHILKLGAYANFLDQDDEHVAAERMRNRFDLRVWNMVENLSERMVDEPKSVIITQNQDLYLDEN